MMACCEMRVHALRTPGFDVVTEFSETMLYNACYNMCLDCVRWLVEEHNAYSIPNLDDDDLCDTPLHCVLANYRMYPEASKECPEAVAEQWRPIVLALCRNTYKKGAIDQLDWRGDTPLARTVLFEDVPFMQLFLDYGAQLSNVKNGHSFCKKKIPKWAVDVATGRENCHKAVIVLIGIRRFGHSQVMQNNVRDIATLIAKTLWQTRFDGKWVPEVKVTKPKQRKQRKVSKKL